MKRNFLVQLAALIWVCTLFAMTIIFPFQGARGGFFHSSAALLPIIWATVPVGLNTILDWAGQRRGWNVREARIVFSTALVVFAIFLSAFTIFSKIIQLDDDQPKWEKDAITYQQIEKTLIELGAEENDIVMMVNPPGNYSVTRRQTIAIPDGDLQTSLEVAKGFNGRYLILEPGHPEGLVQLYANPQNSYPGIKYLQTVTDTHIFLIE